MPCSDFSISLSLSTRLVKSVVSRVVLLLLLYEISEVRENAENPIAEAAPHIMRVKKISSDEQPDCLEEIKNVFEFGRVIIALESLRSERPPDVGERRGVELLYEPQKMLDSLRVARLPQLLYCIDQCAHGGDR